ncbi:MAG: hypothetical protein JWN86_3681 [Planctomycetota bacterium]|nr:hypothetical protein [Planctomycetota bacterium]
MGMPRRAAAAAGLITILALGVTIAAPPGDIGFFEKALQYARSSDGPSLFQADARKFAERFDALPDGPRALQVYQDAFKYGRSNDGPGLFSADAMKFADRFAGRKDGARVLASYQESYKFARKSDGLSLFAAEAMKFAEKRSGLLDPEKPEPLRADAIAKSHPGRVESIKLLADLSRTLADGQKEADALIELATAARTDSDRAALDGRLSKLSNRLKATVIELEKVSLAPVPATSKPK